MHNVIRVLVAKPGLDGHDRGAKVVARGLRDAGFEVIYTGLHQTPEMVVNAALQEDVDIIGLSILSGAHIPLVAAIQKLMKQRRFTKPIFVGGIIPGDDAKRLFRMGVVAVFGPGSTLQEIADRVRTASLEGSKTLGASTERKPRAKPPRKKSADSKIKSKPQMKSKAKAGAKRVASGLKIKKPKG
jgi:methylmalonyl-CoA mutase C-terminal domain/subunit